MSNKLSIIEKRILSSIQHGFADTTTPYADAAKQAEVTVGQLLEVLRNWQSQGKIRRIGAIVNHFEVGFGAGGMVVWQIEPEQLDEVGNYFAGFKEVSHAYSRKVYDQWPYNLYTMVHGQTDQSVQKTVKKMSEIQGVLEYKILRTERELKKVPPTYIFNRNC